MTTDNFLSDGSPRRVFRVNIAVRQKRVSDRSELVRYLCSKRCTSIDQGRGGAS